MRDDILKLVDLIDNQRIFGVDFNDYDRVYPYTTENLKGYLPDVQGKSVLSVAGSGDHYLNLATLGAKEIDSFDINLFALYYLKLKKAAVQAFQFDEFFQFMNDDCLSSIEKIRPYLDEDTYRFWSFYVQAYAYRSGILATNLFYPKIGEKDFARRNIYFDSACYYQLQNNLKDHHEEEFFHGNIHILGNLFHRKYDYIFLSNISSYQNDFPSFQNLILGMRDFLNDDGCLYYGYYYCSKGSGLSYFPKHIEGTEIIDIPSVYQRGSKIDKVLVLKKENSC